MISLSNWTHGYPYCHPLHTILVSFARKYEVYVGYSPRNSNWKFSHGHKMKKNGTSSAVQSFTPTDVPAI